MSDSNSSELLTVKKENACLRKRIAELEAQILFLGQHKTLAAGIRGELLVSENVNGSLTLHTAPVDVITDDGTRIEVKYAKKTASIPAYPNHLRWQWQKVLGETGQKNFDFLLLIGEADDRYRSMYRDKESPFVMFCLTPMDVKSVMIKGTRGANGIVLSCNPNNSRSVASRLFNDCQITQAEIKSRFGSTIASILSESHSK